MTVRDELQSLLPARSCDEVARKRVELRKLRDEAYRDPTRGDWKLFCALGVGISTALDIEQAARILLEKLWALGLIDELPRTDQELLSQVRTLVQKLRGDDAERLQTADELEAARMGLVLS